MTINVKEVPAAKAARFHAFSSSPEEEAYKAMETWAAPKGYLVKDSAATIYGYNNPNPSAGSPNYGYEFIVVADDLSGAQEVIDFPGGRYAVADSGVSVGVDDPAKLGDAWKQIVQEVERQGHVLGKHQWLELHTFPAIQITLYVPLA
jgi:hypothetical protein